MRVNIINVPNQYHQEIKKTVSDFVKREYLNSDCTINIRFVSKEEIKRLNNQYRRKNEPTDVLSFPIWKNKKDIPKIGEVGLGDIIISPEMTNVDQELAKIINHSLDHLIGKHH